MTENEILKRAKVKKHIIPYTLYAPSQSAKKCWESEEIYGVEDGENTFNYNINDYGFRWTRKNAKRKWLFIGCSHTFGQGVAQEDTFGELICNEIDPEIECINLGLPGTGPQIQCLNLCWALNTFDIEAIFWYMPPPHRQIFVQKDALHTYHPSALEWFHDKKFAKLWDKIQPNFEETNAHRTIWELYNVFSLAKVKNTKMYFKCWDPQFSIDTRTLHKYFDFVDLPDLPKKDMGRDWLHRGPKSHKAYAKMILEVIK